MRQIRYWRNDDILAAVFDDSENGRAHEQDHVTWGRRFIFTEPILNTFLSHWGSPLAIHSQTETAQCHIFRLNCTEFPQLSIKNTY